MVLNKVGLLLQPLKSALRWQWSAQTDAVFAKSSNVDGRSSSFHFVIYGRNLSKLPLILVSLSMSVFCFDSDKLSYLHKLSKLAEI